MYKILFSCVAILICFSINANAIQLTIAYEDKEQPPYYMGNSKKVLDDKPGVAVEMIMKVGEKIEGVEIIFKRYPWKRCLFLLKANRVDGIFNASYKKKRLEMGWYPTKDNKIDGTVDPSRSITNISYVLYKLKGSPVEWDGEKINNLSGPVGAPFGYSVVDDLEKKGYSVNKSYDSEKILFKLIKKKVGVVALQDVTADSIIKLNSEKYKNVEKIHPPLAVKPYYLMLSKKILQENPKLAQQIWDTIKVIRETEFDELVLKYGKK